MARHKVLDESGQPVDPSKNLAQFLEGIPQSDITEATDTPPPWKSVKFEVDDPDLNGKTGEDALLLLQQTRAKAKEAEDRAANLEKQMASDRQKSEMEATARRVLQEQQAKSQEPDKAPEDPRIAQIDELWFTDPPAARRLLSEVNAEIADSKAKAAEDRAFQRAQKAVEDRDNRTASLQSFDIAFQALKSEGIEIDAVRAKTILREVVDPTSPFFQNRSLYNPANLIGVARALFGRGAPPPAAAMAPAPVAAAAASPVAAAPIVAPPGSARPAPATAPARQKSTAIDPRMQRDYEHMAEVFGLDKDKLIARRTRRLQAEEH